ncbi:hypothetical protein LX99_02679 [Mucilaginibacter oryzae]|uniref:Uncharacterized protein n=1 Tax=Mucilaginibacter oryzae TaxID=468058 RepID=A0A316H9S1_9SPHI|nr:hypothetical protein LX99_02679 [Mucilaginibacter oryzae]
MMQAPNMYQCIIFANCANTAVWQLLYLKVAAIAAKVRLIVSLDFACLLLC